jgi:hypothetical protein
MATALFNRVTVFLVLAAGLTLPFSAFAAEMLQMKLWEEEGRYHLRSSSQIKAPPDLIFKTLIDYDNFHRLSGGIKETRYLKPDQDGTAVAFTLVETCVLSFCKSIKKTERLTTKNNTEIHLEVDPERSDFLFMHSTWIIKADGDYSELSYNMDMQPDFWIPPLIGTWVLKRKLHTTAMNMAHRLEKMAASGTQLKDFTIKVHKK